MSEPPPQPIVALPGGDVVPYAEALDGTLGFVVDEIGPDRVAGRIPVTNAVRQRVGLVHGGAYAALAEMLASEGTVSGVLDDGMIGVGLSNDSKFLRPVSEGVVFATGVPLHRGRTTWVWDVTFADEQGRTCAVSRVTIAVRERRDDRPGMR
jgi:1,4-dihydroxy-2-naphthoyl-CoA hydrolase